MSSIMRRRKWAHGLVGHGDAPVLSEVVETPRSQDRTPRCAIPSPLTPAAVPYRASGLVLWHKADQPIALADVRFRGTSGLGLSTCDAARPSVAAAPLHLGWHRHRMVLADTAPRPLGGMGLRRGPRRATDTRTEWPAKETGRRRGCS